MKDNPKKRNKALSPRYLVYDLIKLTASLPGLIWFRTKFLYISPAAKERIRGGALLISNHTGFFDPVYLQFVIWYRRHHFICLKQFFEGRWGWLFKFFLCIPIDRDSFSIESLRNITDHLRAGELVTMFPEGHVNDGSGRIAAFKSGVVLMAMQGGVPIVPVYIRPKTRFYQRLVAAVGEPVDIRALYGERPTFSQIESIAELLHEKEEELKAFTTKEVAKP